MYSLDRTIDATIEPVTVGTAKSHCRVQTDLDDDLLALYISSARTFCEDVTGRAFLQQTWRLGLQDFPRLNCGYPMQALVQRPHSFPLLPLPQIQLPRPKLIGIASVTYLDGNGVRQTLDPSQYTVDYDSEPANITPAPGCYWPFTLRRPGAVQLTYVAGYGTAPSAVPTPLQLAILQLVGHWYENREATIVSNSGTGVVDVPMSVTSVLQNYVVDAFTYES